MLCSVMKKKVEERKALLLNKMAVVLKVMEIQKIVTQKIEKKNTRKRQASPPKKTFWEPNGRTVNKKCVPLF